MVQTGDREGGIIHCGKCYRDHTLEGLDSLVCTTRHIVKKPVLLIEDDDDVASLMVTFIKNMKLYDVLWARSVTEARQLFSRGRYFAVLLDLGLRPTTLEAERTPDETPVERGIKLAQEMRLLDDNVFIAVVTGYYPIFDARLVDAVDDLLSKPVDMECLQSKLFMWSIKYNRRLALKQYIDERTLKYMKELEEIRHLEVTLGDTMKRLAEKYGIREDSEKHLEV